MNIIGSIFERLIGYEKLMPISGLILFVFTLVAVAVLLAHRRDFKMAMVLIVFSIVLMAFPSTQATRFNDDMGEIDNIRAQPTAPTDPSQKVAAQVALENLAQRAGGNPQLLAKISDRYRAIGEVHKAYQLALSLLDNDPLAPVRSTLVPVLTAELNEVEAAASIPIPAAIPCSLSPATCSPDATATPAATPTATAVTQKQIATIAIKLQNTGAAPLAASHAALAKVYVVGQPKQAQANVDAALRLDAGIKINASFLHAAMAGNTL